MSKFHRMPGRVPLTATLLSLAAMLPAQDLKPWSSLLAAHDAGTLLPTVSYDGQRSDRHASETSDINSTGCVTFTRSGPTDAELPVLYTISGTAILGGDYAPISGRATIPAGERSLTIFIVPIDDQMAERDETVTLTLAASALYSLGKAAQGTVVIAEDDRAAVVVSPPIGAVAPEGGGTATVNVQLSSKPTGPVTVAFEGGSKPLTFLPENWLTPQPVTLTGVTGLRIDGKGHYVLFPRIDSTDPLFGEPAPMRTPVVGSVPGSAPGSGPAAGGDAVPPGNYGSVEDIVLGGDGHLQIEPSNTVLMQLDFGRTVEMKAPFEVRGTLEAYVASIADVFAYIAGHLKAETNGFVEIGVGKWSQTWNMELLDPLVPIPTGITDGGRSASTRDFASPFGAISFKGTVEDLYTPAGATGSVKLPIAPVIIYGAPVGLLMGKAGAGMSWADGVSLRANASLGLDKVLAFGKIYGGRSYSVTWTGGNPIKVIAAINRLMFPTPLGMLAIRANPTPLADSEWNPAEHPWPAVWYPELLARGSFDYIPVASQTWYQIVAKPVDERSAGHFTPVEFASLEYPSPMALAWQGEEAERLIAQAATPAAQLAAEEAVKAYEREVQRMEAANKLAQAAATQRTDQYKRQSDWMGLMGGYEDSIRSKLAADQATAEAKARAEARERDRLAAKVKSIEGQIQAAQQASSYWSGQVSAANSALAAAQQAAQQAAAQRTAQAQQSAKAAGDKAADKAKKSGASTATINAAYTTAYNQTASSSGVNVQKLSQNIAASSITNAQKTANAASSPTSSSYTPAKFSPIQGSGSSGSSINITTGVTPTLQYNLNLNRPGITVIGSAPRY